MDHFLAKSGAEVENLVQKVQIIWYKCRNPHVKIVHYLRDVSGIDVAKLAKNGRQYANEISYRCSNPCEIW